MEQQFRVTQSGKVITETEFRAMLDRMNIMPPSILTMRDLQEHGVEPIMDSEPPAHAPHQSVRREGIRLNALNYWEHVWVVEALPEGEVAAKLKSYVDNAVNNVDDAVAAIYAKHVRFQLEYQLREQAAKSFFATGRASGDIARLATNMKISVAEAATLVLAQANNFYAALTALGGLRMDKYLIVHAATIEEAEVHYHRIISEINQIAGSLS